MQASENGFLGRTQNQGRRVENNLRISVKVVGKREAVATPPPPRFSLEEHPRREERSVQANRSARTTVAYHEGVVGLNHDLYSLVSISYKSIADELAKHTEHRNGIVRRMTSANWRAYELP